MVDFWSCVHFVNCNDFESATRKIADYDKLMEYRLDLKAIVDKRSLLDAIELLMDFPAMFRVSGNLNWDALLDGLRSLEQDEKDGAGFLLVLDNANRLWAQSPLVAGTLIELWMIAAEFWARKFGKAFHLNFLLI